MTGVAAYSAALLRALQRHEPGFASGIVVNPDPGVRCDIAVYHSGNNPLHAAIHGHAAQHPGVVVLHDAVLHHFHLGSREESRYVSEFVANYGEWHRGTAARLWRRRACSGGDPEYFRYPMLRGLVERARLVIVHNPAADRAARDHGAANVAMMPHLFEPPEPVDSWEVIRARARFGDAALVCGILGHLRESKRVIPAIQAAEAVRRRGHDVRLLVAGEFASGDLERTVAPWLRRDWIVRLPYLDERSFWIWAFAIDACINLRYPAAGETSGIGIRLMGIGKAVVVTAGEETAGIPADACLRIDGGAAEREMLEATLLWLAGNRHHLRAIGERARTFIGREHDAASVAGRFRELVSTAALS
jgi:glycosyltransferase involved in cell wall biosynthesis